MSDRPQDSLKLFEDQLTSIAHALVAEAPDAPEYPRANDPASIDLVDTSITFGESGPSRRWSRVVPLAAAALLAIAVGMAVVLGRGSETVADPATIVAQPDDPAPTESQVMFVPLPSDLPQQVSATEDERFAALAPTPRDPGVYRIAVARPGAGVAIGSDGRRELFVYDEPYGEPRRISAMHADRILSPGIDGRPAAFPVLAGDDTDPWLQVLVNTWSGPRSAWLPTSDMELVPAASVVVLNLRNLDNARIQVVQSGQLAFEAPISIAQDVARNPFAAQGFVAGGMTSADGESAAVTRLELSLTRLDLSSMPQGQLLSIRPERDAEASATVATMSPDALDHLTNLLRPGTRVFVQDDLDLDVDVELERLVSASATSPLAGPQRMPTPNLEPLWTACPTTAGVTTICRSPEAPLISSPAIGTSFLVARPDAGSAAPAVLGPTPTSSAQVPSSPTEPAVAPPIELTAVASDRRVIPVFDAPGGQERMLVYTNDVLGSELLFPLTHPTIFGQPLVLRVVRGLPGDEWIEVQAPTRPTRRSVWVRARDFAFATTTLAIEVDARVGGELTLFERAEPVLRSAVVSARDSRPHTLHDTLIDQVFAGSALGPVYGNWIATHSTWSDALGTFGRGIPGQTLHGTNQPELVDQAVTSGGIRVSNETMQQLVDAGEAVEGRSALLGASIVIYHDDDMAAHLLRLARWEAAKTEPFDPTAPVLEPLPSYS